MPTNRIRRSLTLLAGAAGLAAAGWSPGALAQAFPAKPLRFVVPFPAGSATDNQIIAELINRGKLLTDVPAGG